MNVVIYGVQVRRLIDGPGPEGSLKHYAEMGITGVDTLESELAESELRRELIEAVKALGEPDTSIIIRKYYLGESSRTIADALNMSVSSVDTRTHRALNKLKNLFGGEK